MIRAITAGVAAAVTLAAPTSAAAMTAESTAYCLTGVMADGTGVRAGSAASNRHPLGTRITLDRPGPGGRRRWTVRDRIGSGSELDLWVPRCGQATAWGRRIVTYAVGWPAAERLRLVTLPTTVEGGVSS